MNRIVLLWKENYCPDKVVFYVMKAQQTYLEWNQTSQINVCLRAVIFLRIQDRVLLAFRGSPEVDETFCRVFFWERIWLRFLRVGLNLIFWF